jgi:hypothetical protein
MPGGDAPLAAAALPEPPASALAVSLSRIDLTP